MANVHDFSLLKNVQEGRQRAFATRGEQRMITALPVLNVVEPGAAAVILRPLAVI